jgi:hypothetical protein
MKTLLRYIFALIVLHSAIIANAQQINTLYFLENAPMRHTINPAFQPISKGFVNISPLGWMSVGVGNTSLTMSDLFYLDPQTGHTITPLHPNGDKQALLKSLNNMTLINGDATLGVVNMGFRIKEKGYFTIGLNQHIEIGSTLPRAIPQIVLGGFMTNLEGTNSFNLSRLGAAATIYTELAFGYSHQINEKWTVGGKLKVLVGQANIGINAKNLTLDANIEQWNMKGNLELSASGLFNLPQDVIDDLTTNNSPIIDYSNPAKLIMGGGFGAAIDFGFTYKPNQHVQISAALNDLGFIHWGGANKYTCTMDTTFVGAGEFEYSDPAFHDQEGNFSTQLLLDSALSNMQGLANAIRMEHSGNAYNKMISAKLNLGIDANFLNNKLTVGLLSATRLYNARLYEEITIGVGYKPFNWLNIAASYSLMNNGKFSNIGAGLSIMPKDGINMTLALDYIPTTYAGIDIKGKTQYILPYKSKMVNVALGFSVCWGTNPKEEIVTPEQL